MLIKNEYKPKMLPKQSKGKKPVTSNGRIVFVLGALGIGFLALIGRGLYLQTSNHEFLTEEGNKTLCPHAQTAGFARRYQRPKRCHAGPECAGRIAVRHSFRG